MSLPLFIRQPKCRGTTEAVSSARQIGLALHEFELEYGRYPDETTAEKVRQKTGTAISMGNSSSNDYFRQLIAAGCVSTEHIFFSKTSFTNKTIYSTQSTESPLAPGTAGFGYLMNGKSAFENKGNPARPLACTPLAFDGRVVSRRTFDRSIDDDKAVILRMDTSVQTVPIEKKSKLAMLGGGKSLLDTGPDTVWGESATPVIIPPLPKR